MTESVATEVESQTCFHERDFYEILGVPVDASIEDIKRAYKKRILEHHPDKNAGDTEGSTQRFTKIREAYEVLTDVEKRRKYDRRKNNDEIIDFRCSSPSRSTGYTYTQPDKDRWWMHSSYHSSPSSYSSSSSSSSPSLSIPSWFSEAVVPEVNEFMTGPIVPSSGAFQDQPSGFASGYDCNSYEPTGRYDGYSYQSSGGGSGFLT